MSALDPLQFYLMHFMPYPDVVPGCPQGQWADIPNSHFDAKKGHKLYKEYIDELVLGDKLGYDGLVVNEHHATFYSLMPSCSVIAGALLRGLRKVSAVAAIMVAGIVPLVAQDYRAQRGPDGKPDLNGIWQALNEANYDLEAHMARPALALRPGPYVPVPAARVLALGAVGAVPPGLGVVEGGEIPYKPEALAQRKQNREDWLNLDPEIKCYLPGVPRATYMPYPFQILQSASALTFAYEYAGAVRTVFLESPGPAPANSWMGQSVGRWEGDTLVVDVTDMNDQTWFDRAGNFHSDKLHVVERYTRTSPDVISYEATIEDPNIFTRSWKISMPLYRRQEKNAQLLDFRCVEFVEELLYGQYRKHPLKE